MKLCMIGLGSIGSRHLHNATWLLKKRSQSYRIDALRETKKNLKPEIAALIDREYTVPEELPDDYDIIFITNPTAMHLEIFQKVKKKTKHLFVEKPVFMQPYEDMDALCEPEGSVYYVACPLRQHPAFGYVKELLDSGEHFFSIRAVSSSYLPSWRVGVDYRQVYSAKKDLGGGVSLDLIHEWDYIIYLFGWPEAICNICGHYSALEIDTDDISVYLARYKDKVVEIHLDYVGHKTVRRLELFGNRKRVDVDFIQNVAEIYEHNELNMRLQFSQEDIYKKEMAYFLDCVEGKVENKNSIKHANMVLKYVTGSEQL